MPLLRNGGVSERRHPPNTGHRFDQDILALVVSSGERRLIPVERLRSVAARLTDQQTIEGAAVLVVELEAPKGVLHPPDGKPQA